jgi:hypothetical protein
VQALFVSHNFVTMGLSGRERQALYYAKRRGSLSSTATPRTRELWQKWCREHGREAKILHWCHELPIEDKPVEEHITN